MQISSRRKTYGKLLVAKHGSTHQSTVFGVRETISHLVYRIQTRDPVEYSHVY